MNNFSVVIPAMWRYSAIVAFIYDLIEFDTIDEILIIDNDQFKRLTLPDLMFIHHPKVRLVKSGGNIGCNAAWNLGVAEAKNENICIMNDDIIFDMRAFYRAMDTLSEDKPLIGMSAGDPIHHQPPITDGKIDVVEWKAGMHTHGFGCLFFVRKSWWIPIPKDLFLYYGDNWAFDTTLIRQKPIHILTNLMYNTPFAVTSSEIGTNEMLMNEHRIYHAELEKWNSTR